MPGTTQLRSQQFSLCLLLASVTAWLSQPKQEINVSRDKDVEILLTSQAQQALLINNMATLQAASQVIGGDLNPTATILAKQFEDLQTTIEALEMSQPTLVATIQINTLTPKPVQTNTSTPKPVQTSTPAQLPATLTPKLTTVSSVASSTSAPVLDVSPFIDIDLGPRGCGATYRYDEYVTWTVTGVANGDIHFYIYSPLGLSEFDPNTTPLYAEKSEILNAHGSFDWSTGTGSLGNWTLDPPLEFGVVVDFGSGPTTYRQICRAYFVPWEPEN